MLPLELLPLTDAERAHESRVREGIAAAIEAAGGWLVFEEFMQFSLYAPGLGYYAAGAHKLGAGGDFITSPEIAPVFGDCLASQCAEVLAGLGGGDILEIGAGSGVMAEQILRGLAKVGQLPDKYRILEVSPDLRDRQKKRLASLPLPLRARVEWLDEPPALPYAGVLLANEVIDALPVARLRATEQGLMILGVEMHADQLRETARPAGMDTVRRIANMGIELASGQEMEWCPRLPAWLLAVTQSLSAGVALFIDYGDSRSSLYSADRPQGTLAAFHRHRLHHDPYVHLGLQDLTAWVDFTAVAESAIAAGLEVVGYTTQACFLLGCGFERHLASWRAALPEAEEPLAARAALRLVLPNDMGERFKCMALARNYDGPLMGFSIKDLTGSL
jgi:hypothetical protein